MLALYFQEGLGYSPLRSGLTVTPFAIGVAVSALIAGRLVSRFGRWVTLCGLTATVLGLIATALVLRDATGDPPAWAIVGPLLVAGLGRFPVPERRAVARAVQWDGSEWGSEWKK
ncbi:MFS transporter [Rhodococcus sp. JVH1]|uniref:MFS transporter n=1 Tax=Rhodococcus sp. JVH1 TaxID=745408 RepID=UPI000271E12B|nr:putative actinorhodin transporter domain protein [Rhodococcus sp. JVH1]